MLLPKVLVVGSEKLNELISENIKGVKLNIDLQLIDVHIDNVVSITKEYLSKDNIDVIISAGGNLDILKRNFIRIPIISITPSDYDLLKAIYISSQLDKDVVILSFHRGIELLDDVKELFKIKMRQEVIMSVDQAKETIKMLKDEGITNVIGGSLVSKLCKELGMSCTYINSNETIIKAIKEAEQVAQSIKLEQRNNRLIKTVLDLSENGLIVTDNNNKIQLLNQSAKIIFKLEGKDMLGKRVDNLFKSEKLSEIFTNKEAIYNKTVKLENTHIVFNRIPLISDGKNEGLVISFNDVNTIAKVEQSVRNQLHKKGLFAAYHFDDIIGNSKVLTSTIKKAKSFSLTELTILLYGETGTGKELFAQSIHNSSLKAKGPFVAVNCAAIPEELLESELFGYDEGSFTGAKKGGKIGLFELAHNGTIFLDEIGEISTKLQSQLLRVLQEKRVRKVGSDQIIPINVRVICATNRDLLSMVKKGEFREDLYYRLNVLNLKIPSLRERKNDIPELIKHFSQKMEGSNFNNNLLFAHLHKYMDELKNYPWPGNIRELEHFIEKCYVIFHNIGKKDLEEEIKFLVNLNHDLDESESTYQSLEYQYISTRDIKNEDIISALEHCDGNKSKAAEMLGISRATLWRKLKAKS
jgi:transcriptional regulator, propionate catabolism operon regulatory protein